MTCLFSSLPTRGRRPAIFLDRDGLINERIVGGYVTSTREFRFIEGIVPALRALSRLKLPMIVVSNQAGVGKGLMGRAALGHITRRFVGELIRRGARVDAVYYCPHSPDRACECRKPKPGLLLQAARDWRIDLRRSVMVGDSVRDVEAAAAAGCQGILFDPSGDFIGDLNLVERATPRAPEPAARITFVTVRRLDELPAQVAAMLGRSLPCDCMNQAGLGRPGGRTIAQFSRPIHS